jgi:hypothetical protein
MRRLQGLKLFLPIGLHPSLYDTDVRATLESNRNGKIAVFFSASVLAFF